MTLRYILTLLLVLLLCSCNRRPAPLYPALQRAEQLMKEHPDSALAVLNNLNQDSFANRYQKEAYQVLFVQANDRCYQPITPYKKNMVNAISFFDSIGGNPSLQAKAHYYLGRIQQDEGDDAGTAKEFVTALPLIEDSKDSLLLCSAKSNLGFLFWNNGLYDDAEPMYKETIVLNQLQKDNEGLAISYSKLGDIYMQKKHPDFKMAELFLMRALYYISKCENNEIKVSIYSSLATLYQETHHPLLALKYTNAGLSICNSSSSGGFYLSKGISYFETSRYDSAYIYLIKSLSVTKNMYTKATAYRMMSKLMEKQNNLKGSVYYHKLSDVYNDSVMASSSNSEVVKAIQNVRQKQAAANTKYRIHHYRLYIIASLVLIAIIVILILKYRRNSSMKIETLDSENREKRLTIEKLQVEIDNNTRKRQNYEEKAPLLIKFKDHPIYNKIVSSIDHNNQTLNPSEKITLTDEEWKEFQNIVNDIFLGFIEQLEGSRYLLTSQDVSFCCLVRLEFNYSEIAGIFGCTPQAITKRKRRLFNQFGVESTTAFEKVLKNI